MPAIHSNRILAFVEGTMEKMFINNNFSYVHVTPVSNGSGWSPNRIAEFIGSSYRIKNLNPDLIIVWIDKENHDCNSDEFCNKIFDALVSKGADSEKIRICLADMMTENIILADEKLIREEFLDSTYIYDSEGKNGKRILSSLYATKGINYKETREGTALMKKVNLHRAAIKSPAAARFINDFPIANCWWINTK